MGLLFERFLSLERPEPPDIDVDFEHERREEVLQYVYGKHGRHRAGMVCEVICYRGRLAIREVGKALGLSLDQVDRLAKRTELAAERHPDRRARGGGGARPEDPGVQRTLALAQELEGFPRHLSIHVGGFVITHGELVELVPVENASMKDRTVVQWEKDDLNALGIFKVDLLGLGMLTRARQVPSRWCGSTTGIDARPGHHPRRGPGGLRMLGEADAIGVFQVESRAQMNMLPRLRPRELLRPGDRDRPHPPGAHPGRHGAPLPAPPRGAGGGDVPVARRCSTSWKRRWASRCSRSRRCGSRSPPRGSPQGEADALRRALSHKRAEVLLVPWRERFVERVRGAGATRREYAEKCFEQFKGFATTASPSPTRRRSR